MWQFSLSRFGYIRLSVILALLINSFQLHADTKEQYTFGVFPYVSPTQLVRFHSPLRNKLEKIVGKPVSLVTAPTFKEFIKRTKMKKYDFIMTAPHLGRLAEVRDEYQPMAHTMHKVQGVYLVKKDSPMQTISDLKGKTVSAVGRAALITQMAMQQLADIGLQPDKDVHFKLSKNHNTSMYAPLRGESDASVTGILIWGKVTKNAELRKKMRVLGETSLAPGFMVMANKDINKELLDVVKNGLTTFHDTAEGKKYLDNVGFVKFKGADRNVMKELDPYIQIFLGKKKEVK